MVFYMSMNASLQIEIREIRTWVKDALTPLIGHVITRNQALITINEKCPFTVLKFKRNGGHITSVTVAWPERWGPGVKVTIEG